MSRKWMLWVLLPALAVVIVGCPKKKPEPVQEDIQMETEEVAPPTEEVPEPTPPPEDKVEVDPLQSQDLREVNEAAADLGFDPNVYFDFDKSELRPEAREALTRNAAFLRQHPEFLVTIEGHCDERGTNEYNLALGERRANSAKGYLTSLGVDGSALRTISYGEERPVCTQSDEACWQRNRRAHMVITGRR